MVRAGDRGAGQSTSPARGLSSPMPLRPQGRRSPGPPRTCAPTVSRRTTARLLGREGEGPMTHVVATVGQAAERVAADAVTAGEWNPVYRALDAAPATVRRPARARRLGNPAISLCCAGS